MPSGTSRSLYYGWLPRSREVYWSFYRQKVDLARKRKKAVFDSKVLHTDPVQRFADAILGDDTMVKLFDQIFLQVNTDPKWVDPNYVVTDFDSLLYLLDIIVYEPPKYYKAKREDGTIIAEPIGVPLSLVLDMLCNTIAAYDLFRYGPFNVALKNLLDSWGTYLCSTPSDPYSLPSNSSLNTSEEGWFGAVATADFEPYLTPLTFETTYQCPDPGADNRGFTSWDHFFVREFVVDPPARPIEAPDNLSIIRHACESTTARIATNVKLHDTFWLKDRPYSLYDIFNRDDEIAKKFENGTVYQALLSPQDYHRWHSPIKGTVTDAFVLPGTYHAVLPDDGAPPRKHPDDLEEGDPHGAIVRSLPWLNISAARALVFIEADNPAIGLMCFIAVGMAEVSTCEITVKPNQRVVPGEQLGMFHFGGSTHTLVFGPQAKLTFTDIELNTHYWINTPLATVSPN